MTDKEIQTIVKKAQRECQQKFLQGNLIITDRVVIEGLDDKETIYSYAFNAQLAYLHLLDLEQEAIQRREAWELKVVKLNEALKSFKRKKNSADQNTVLLK